MQEINTSDRKKLLQLLECTEKELDSLINKTNYYEKDYNLYSLLLKILQQGLNIREATLLGILEGKKIGYNIAKIEIEQEIKEKLYKAFKNNQY